MVGPFKPRPCFFGQVVGRGRPKIVTAPRPFPRGGDHPRTLPGSFLVLDRLSERVLLGRAQGAGRGDFVTTVDQSDIRGLVTGMRAIRQGLPPSTYGRRSLPCGRRE